MVNEERQAGTTADSSTKDDAALSVRQHNTNALVGRSAYIITAIDGVKHYVRRKSISAAGRAAVTMVTTNKGKALDFGSVKNASDFKDRLGIGYAIEVG